MKLWDRAVRERTKLPTAEKPPTAKITRSRCASIGMASKVTRIRASPRSNRGKSTERPSPPSVWRRSTSPSSRCSFPGLVRNWETLDVIRAKVQREFERAFNAAGYRIGEIGGFGMAHLMSKGFAVASPGDMQGKRPYVFAEDPVGHRDPGRGRVTPVPLSVPEVLPALARARSTWSTHRRLAAEQLQWASRLDHIVTDVSGAGIGAMILANRNSTSSRRTNRPILHDTGKIATAALNVRIRNEEANAFARLKGRMTVTELTDAQRKEWTEVFRQAQTRSRREPSQRARREDAEARGTVTAHFRIRAACSRPESGHRAQCGLMVWVLQPR